MHIRKDVLKLTAPIMFEQTFIMLIGVINAIMAGRTGKETVSAIGMIDSLNNIFIAFFSAMSVGGTVVVAHYAGRERHSETNEAAKQAIASGVFLSAAITLLIWLFRHPLLQLLFGVAEKQVFDNAISYLDITLPTYPFIALTSIACGVLRGAGDTKTPMKITIFMNIINIILSYILIYGVDLSNSRPGIRIPSLKIKGAALGIASARTLGALMVILVLLRGTKMLKFHIKELKDFRLDMGMQASIFGIGVPASVESLLFNGGKLITQIFIVGMGTASIAANYIGSSVFSIICIPGTALSIAATTLIGHAIGRGESEEAGNLMFYIIKLSTVALLIPCIVVLPLTKALTSFYTQSEDVMALAVRLIMLSAITMPLLWPASFILPAGLKAAGDARYTMVTAIIGMWVFRITLGYVLGVPLGMGVVGVWCGMYVDWVVRGAFYYHRLKRGKWKGHNVIRRAETYLNAQ